MPGKGKSRKEGLKGKCSAGRRRRAPQCVSVPPSPPAATRPSKSGSYFVFPPPIFPLVPIFGRRTFRYDVLPGKIWRFEQKQGIGLGLNVAVNVRMTVIKMASGGLFVYAPVAPTAECLALLSELDAPVEYIVLPTTLFEHKLFMGPFSRRFPRAQSFVVPGQWSWPLNLPSTFFGIFNAKPLDDAAAGAALPFADEFEVQILSPRPVGVSSLVKFNEAAVFHKPTRTLLVTDCVVHVSDTPSEVCAEKELLESGDDNNFVINSLKLLNLFNIRDKAKSRTTSSADMTREERLRLGWQRNTLQALYFGPNNLLDPEESWQRITNRLLVAPVVVTLVYSNCADDVFEWVDRVCKWKFTRIIPCHLDAPIMASPVEFKSAFSVLNQDGSKVFSHDDSRSLIQQRHAP